MTLDSEGLAKPIGFLPETTYGTVMTGTTVNGGHIQGDTTIEINDTYNEDDIVGLRVSINSVNYVVTDYSDDVGIVMTINPGLAGAIDDNTPVYLYPIPVPHQITKIDPQDERAKDTWGGVGGGIVRDNASQGAREVGINLEGRKGRDLFKFYPAIHNKSSWLAHMFSDDGTRDSSTGQVTFRTTSDAPSFTLFWATKTNEIRVAPGCVISTGEENWEEDIASMVKVSFDLMAQKIDKYTEAQLNSVFSIKTVPSPYLGPLMKSHGGSKIQFYFKTAITWPANDTETRVQVGSVRGFSVNDAVTITNHNGNTQSTSITGIITGGNITAAADGGGGTVTFSSSTHGLAVSDVVRIEGTTSYDGQYQVVNVPDVNSFKVTATFVSNQTGIWKSKIFTLNDALTYDQQDNLSWVEQTAAQSLSIKAFTVKTMSGQDVVGDISQNVDYKTDSLANGYEVECEVSFRRDSMTMYNWQDDEVATTRLIVFIYEYESTELKDISVSIRRSVELAPVGPITEPVSDEREEMIDELSFKLVGTPTLWLSIAE